MNFLEYLKFYFSASYRKKYINDREWRPIGYGEVNWVYIEDDGNKIPKLMSVIFYENNLGERTYKVNASDYEIKTFWHRLKAFHEVKLWEASGIRPNWFEDILQKKLMS